MHRVHLIKKLSALSIFLFVKRFHCVSSEKILMHICPHIAFGCLVQAFFVLSCYKFQMKNRFINIGILLFLSACNDSDSSSKTPVNSLTSPHQIGPVTKVPPIIDDNYFSEPMNWGIYQQFIDFSGAVTLAEDTRVDEYYKINLPQFSQNYVLWRVTHDGSCWIQAGMVVILNGLLSLEKSQFEEALVKWKNYAANLRAKHVAFKKFSESGELKKFFDLIAALGRTANLKEAMHMLNHTAIKNVFNQSLRHFIDPGQEDIDLCEFGDLSRAHVLSGIIGIPLVGFSSEGELGGYAPANSFMLRIFADKAVSPLIDKAYWNQEIMRLGRAIGADNKIQEKYIKNYHVIVEKMIMLESDKLPKIMYLRSRPLYMDLAVLKTYSDAINSL